MPVLPSSEELRTERESLVQKLVIRIEGIITAAGEETRPLEVEPYRGNLFEVFATAERAGLLTAEEPNLTSETMTRILAGRWKLKEVVEMAGKQSPESDDHLRKMQLLWSILRMWMEWTYAWDRWAEFHDNKA